VRNLSPASPTETSNAGGFGIIGVRERAAAVDGTIDINTEAGAFEVTATLPTHTWKGTP